MFEFAVIAVLAGVVYYVRKHHITLAELKATLAALKQGDKITKP